MKLLKTGLTAVALAASLSGAVHASPVFAAGADKFFYNTFENLYRPSATCGFVVGDGDCELAKGSDPSGYQRVNINLGNNLAPGDIFIGIMNITTVTNNGNTTYASPGAGSNNFTGYFVQEVTQVGQVPGSTIGAIKLGTVTTDPFGILGSNELFRLFANTAAFTSGSTSFQDDIKTAVGGVAGGDPFKVWAGFGLNLNGEGYAYTRTDTSLSGAEDPNNAVRLALDTMFQGPLYSGGLLNKINDNQEQAVGGPFGGTNFDPIVCTSAQLVGYVPGDIYAASPNNRPVGRSCTDIVSIATVGPNFDYLTGSDWQFGSNDNGKLNRIPEPGSLVLMGVALAGLGLFSRRKSA